VLPYNECTDEFCNLDDQSADEVALVFNIQPDTGLEALLGRVPQRLQIADTGETVTFCTNV